MKHPFGGTLANVSYSQIEQLHAEQFGEHHNDQVLTVYRGQGMSKTDFEQLMKRKGGLIAFNNFLSTTVKIKKFLLV